ncbi:MAG: tRNA pseudouridine(38-40) synthase TruA [Clostridia bacterium]|nr:tRNA pseudouridine(38-40) synthase TruA [Clostridia bacterium]
MTVKLTISYDGTDYVGWQSQKNGVSVQDVLEDALEKVVKKRIRITGSGRTDAGVHALGQTASFSTDAPVPPERYYLALNAVLPKNIRVLKSERAADGFNARFSAKKKTYRYSAYVSEVSNPLLDRYALRLDDMPSIEKMKKCAKFFLGEHDLKSFSSTGSAVKTTVRTIYSVDIKAEDNKISIDVCGNGFLYNTVRIIAGTVFAYAFGKICDNDVIAALNGEKRPAACKTLAANGLTLLSVDYD